MGGFTHLHVASHFSAHHGTRSPELLVAAAAAAGAPAAAITDRDGLYGAIRHVRACIDAGVGPIVGADLQIRTALEDGGERIHPVTVLAHGRNDGAGWAGLCRLVSAAHSPRRDRRPRVHRGTADRTAAVTRDRPAGFLLADGEPVGTLLLGPRSDVGAAITAGDHQHAGRLLADWKQRLPGALAVEIVWHLTRPGQPASLPHAALMLELAHELDVPAVLTNDVRYLHPDDAIAGDVLDAAGLLLPLGGFQPQPNAQAWLKPGAKMRIIARQVVDRSHLSRYVADELLSATEQLAERCVLDPDGDLAWKQPKVPELEAIGVTGDPTEVLWKTCQAGITERYFDAPRKTIDQVHDRLTFEMRTIIGFGYETYFLTVADVATLFRQMRMRHQARGSGVSSLVNYLLRISVVDPLEFDPPLVFERFLGNKRETLPDIDIDVESARRHEAYRRIFDRYGDHRVTLLSMQNRYQARGAVRDAGLALDLPPDQVDMVAKNLWRFQAREFGEVLNEKPELRDVATLIEQHEELQLLVDLTERLDRLPRHISMHPCGVILGNTNLMSTTPVQPSGLGLLMSQYDKDDIDDAGLLKLDVLGVRMQSAIAYSIQEIKRIHGPAAAAAGGFPIDAPFIKDDGTVEVDAAPHDDPATFEAIKTTNTLGMFQIESPGQRELGGRLQADDFGEIVIQVAAFRPGPQKTRSAAGYVDAKMFDNPTYLHDTFKPFLRETRGVVIYHEQILKILHTCTSVTLAEADELRRAMEKDLPRVEHLFRTRTPLQLDRNGNRIYSGRDIDRIWEQVSAFGAYGFAKAHAAAFAATTYHSAFLRTHWPAEFFAGLLTHDPGMYAKRLLAGEAQRLGVPLLPLDVNLSTDTYQVEPVANASRGLGIRIALVNVAGITAKELARILTGQPYASIDDFYTRASPSRPLLTKLAAVGALDSLTMIDGHAADRGDIIAHVRHLTARRSRPRIDETGNQLGIVVDDRNSIPAGHGQLEQAEAIATELGVLGLSTSGHPIDPFRTMLDSLGTTPASQLLTLHNKTEVLVAGIRVATQTPPMPSGKRVVFISVDDGSGVIADATFFDEAQDATGPALFSTRLLIIQGRTRRTGARGVSIEATRAWDLRDEWERWKPRLTNMDR